MSQLFSKEPLGSKENPVFISNINEISEAAKESYAEKTSIFADFCFTTNKKSLSKEIPLRPSIPVISA
jgi:hypothetical protein